MIDTRLLERRIEAREHEIAALQSKLSETKPDQHKVRKAIVAAMQPLIHDQVYLISFLGEIRKPT